MLHSLTNFLKDPILEEMIIKISGQEKFAELTSAFIPEYTIEKIRSGSSSEYYFDTFDWRLFNRNLAFVHTGNEYSLVEYGENRRIISGKSRTIKNKYFPHHFNKSTYEKIKDIVQHRVLLRICKCRNRCEVYAILNTDGKTVINMFYHRLAISNNDKSEYSASIIRLLPLRGYSDDLKFVRSKLFNSGFTGEPYNYLEFIYNYFGRVPGQFSSKIKIQLTPVMSSAEAERLILTKLVDIIIECENGIINDLDIEFLHDYRVSIRKARVLLSEFKNILSPELLKEFKRIFSEIGKRTNALRDLDVYLLNKNKYESYLPDVLKKELNPLFDKIKKERSNEFKKLKRYLNSENYKNNILQLNLLLEEDFSFVGGSSPGNSIFEFSKKIISSRYRKILKTGRSIKENSKDEELHNLRLECKKLRYLLELLGSLFPKDKVEFLIDQLKTLQDNLGDFNDLSVQQEKLKFYLDEIKESSEANMKLASVIGGVITSLHNRQKEVRVHFSETFQKFDSGENRKVIKKLFYK